MSFAATIVSAFNTASELAVAHQNTLKPIAMIITGIALAALGSVLWWGAVLGVSSFTGMLILESIGSSLGLTGFLFIILSTKKLVDHVLKNDLTLDQRSS